MPSGAEVPAAAAGRFRLGHREVARLGLGTMRLTGTLPFHAGVPRDRATSIAVLRRAVELGVDHVDTAAFYFSRTLSALELVGSALAPYDEALTIATKVGPVRDRDGAWGQRGGPESLRGQVEENLRLLGRDHLDLVYFRSGEQGDVTDYVGALADMVVEGVIGQLGVSGVDAEQLDQARTVAPVAAVQNRFSVESPTDLALLHACGRAGIAFVPFFTVSGAGRQGAPTDEPDAVVQVAAELGATAAQVRIAWTLALGDHVLAIPGTGTVAHLEDNVAAAVLRFSDDQLQRLGEA